MTAPSIPDSRKKPFKDSLSETTILTNDQSPEKSGEYSPHGTAETDYSTETVPDHLDFTVEALEGEAGDGEGADLPPGLAAVDPNDGFLTQDAFFVGFCTAFNMGACVPPFLKSLAIQHQEEQTARGASDALYDICMETPALHFLIKPGNVWFQRVAAIGAFAVPKAMGAVAEMKARQAPKAKAKPANQNKKPDNGASDGDVLGDKSQYDFAPADGG